MLFNSYIFIFAFLPITLLGFYLIGDKGRHRIAISWLVGASLLFYGYWNPAYLGLILFSILINYGLGVSLCTNSKTKKKAILICGVAVNLSLIGYFKYANFFVDNVNWIIGTTYNLEKIILPLAISFFTFQQITYLVDAYKGEAKEYNFLHYCLFVTFFPQLIAGPIVHHKEMLPQFSQNILYKINWDNIAIGLTIFTIGLFKKVVIADGISAYATPIFNAADEGIVLSFFESWAGAFAYTFQLYFDFSGYSDMAIGLARMFGVILPLNFHSPYKSKNIIEFWRRWHMTLSRFLKDYVYIPLGGRRKGKLRRHVNLLLTMLVGGLWHGAGWTFIFWGGLHGFYLIVNHAWHALRSMIFNENDKKTTWYGTLLSQGITFIAVVVSWVFFRAETFDGAIGMLNSMFAMNGISISPGLEGYFNFSSSIYSKLFLYEGFFFNKIISGPDAAIFIAVAAVAAFFLPNTQQIMRYYRPCINSIKENTFGRLIRLLSWHPNLISVAITLIAFIYTALLMTTVSEFLYFNF